MSPPTASPDDRAGSPERFGYSWGVFAEILPIHELQFERWTSALEPDAWHGATFLDAGCGMGRNSHWAMQKGAAGGLAIDIDERSLAGARRNLAPWDGVEVRHQSLNALDEAGRFDICFSIGVIHHLGDQQGAVDRMAAAAKPGGRVLVWLYGRENNEWITRWFDPIRKALFSRAPLGLVYALSWFPTALLWLLLKLGWGRLEYHDLLRRLSFRHLRAIVFDHMIPRIASYYTREQAIALLERAGLEDVRAVHVNDISWSVVGRKPG